MPRPIIALTMGDPAGVGPELVLRALANKELHTLCRLAVFGDSAVLELCADITGLPNSNVLKLTPAQFLAGEFDVKSDLPMVVDHQQTDLSQFERCRVSASCGLASFGYIQSSIDAALVGRVSAVTTAPINKEATHAAGISYPGHTEMFAERAAVSSRWCMMQYSEEVTCTFVTVHVGYSEVPGLLSQQSILDTIELTAEAIQRIRNRPAHIAVCGLNPHAGEHGLFGNCEEEKFIIPAIEAARERGISIEGPLPPDTAFLPQKRRQVDAIVCMYHDQGHIPLKALAFDSAVNTTLGLKVVRTSVDHGTAFDIAWQAKASPSSLYAALRLAVKLSD
jgi:4-phospho-D-threonate 3-dehydrogenase / 4-phospho-D-erythronate 3-dehydrogenase